jgi:hypothetical protein
MTNDPHIQSGRDTIQAGRDVIQVGGDYVGGDKIAGNKIINVHNRQAPPAPRQAPALPLYYLERPAELQSICDTLTAPQQHIVAITGIEGVGKTMLASAVVQHTERHFSDGVLWGTFTGQIDDMRNLLLRFLAALDFPIHQLPNHTNQFAENETLVTSLRSALAGKRILLILDNVMGRHFEPYTWLPTDGASRILLTTADRNIAATTASRVIDLSPLPEADAQMLLQHIAGEQVLNALSPDLIASILRQTAGIPDVLKAVGSEARRLQRHGQAALQKWATKLSIDVSDESVRYEFVWHGLSPNERRVIEAIGMLAQSQFDADLIAAALAVSPEDAEAWLAGVESRSLLDWVSSTDLQALSLVHAYAQERLSQSAEQAALCERTIQYLTTWLATATETDSRFTSYLAHLQAAFTVCVERNDWHLLSMFREMDVWLTTVSGQIRVLYKTDWFLALWNSVTMSPGMLVDSNLGLLQANSCTFDHTTVTSVTCAGSQFNSCTFVNLVMIDSDFRGAEFNSCTLANIQMVRVDLRGAQFNNCAFADYIFIDVQMDETTIFRGGSGLDELLGEAAQ